MSLTTRISLITALLLAACVGAGGITLYSRVKSSMHEEMEAKCIGVIAMLQSRMETDDRRLELDEKQPSQSILTNVHWRVRTLDGMDLWSQDWTDDKSLFVKTRVIVLGTEAHNISAKDLKRIKPNGDDGRTRDSFKLPSEESRLELSVSAGVSRAGADASLGHLAIALWTIGPLTVLFGSLLMGMFIRVQLHPLAVMAKEAAAIGPENPQTRIGPAGSSSECVQLRMSLNRMLERMAAGLERERQFSAIAAHELRSPLAQMRTNIEVTLRKPREETEYRRALEESLFDLQRLQTLATNLLSITRGFDALHCKSASANLRAVIDRACKESGSTPAIHGLTESDIQVQGREEMLAAAFRNVFENAIRYAPASPVEVHIEHKGACVQIKVQDGGPGIPETDRERIFDPLIRLDQARTLRDDIHGFGLGLTVARAAMRACGGDLICTGRSDGKPGAVFVFDCVKTSARINISKLVDV